MPWQRRVAVLAGLVLVLSSCSVGGADTESVRDNAASAAGAQSVSPVRVPDLESCTKLPTSTASEMGGERLPNLTLPCLIGGPAINISEFGGRPWS